MYSEWDPLDEIRYTYGYELKDKKILLIPTGSIAAFKTPELVRLLIRHGADVYILPSREALKYVSIDTLKWASGGKVLDGFTYRAEHIYMIKDMDLIAVIPATANIISKAAYGIADTDASLAIHSAMGYGKPIVMAPVMHINMYRNPFYKEAVNRLEEYGVKFIAPDIKEDKAKLRDLNYIKSYLISILSDKILDGLKILVSAGPTIEYIDPVRIITNKSSGKMGVYIAEEAYMMGAKVKLIAGNISINPYEDLDVTYVETTEEMYYAVMEELSNGYDIFISASAPVDYRPSTTEKNKIES
ncbi:TPA: bifunctional phosphopantothenoylcysteine decarboxylase/phosphopantothenate--cysteine ligase CoaBC, partial [Candidatus Geothermarchaeota archaeon]|nr:bifunctional phosphopantothenoylcysteine decarboxylase/phosphopantothenate--cysteine ligase CoaBC [Candidatus Geothermarchaeota archaeon]